MTLCLREKDNSGHFALNSEAPVMAAARHILVAEANAEKIARSAHQLGNGALSKLWAEQGMAVHTSVIYANYDEARSLGTVVAGASATVREKLTHLIKIWF